jgi:hypothetical protein
MMAPDIAPEVFALHYRQVSKHLDFGVTIYTDSG